MEERRAAKNREVFWSEIPRDSERHRGIHCLGGEGALILRGEECRCDGGRQAE